MKIDLNRAKEIIKTMWEMIKEDTYNVTAIEWLMKANGALIGICFIGLLVTSNFKWFLGIAISFLFAGILDHFAMKKGG